MSTLAGDFMGKVAPLWLAVVFGGGCFVTGGTYGFVKLSEYGLDEVEMWQERRQLQLTQGCGGVANDDDDDDELEEEAMQEIIHPGGVETKHMENGPILAENQDSEPSSTGTKRMKT
jgi:hypothetical protein